LDPNNPIVRKTSHKAASHTLQTIFKLYSMVSFHQQTQVKIHSIIIYQRFAVGALDNTIILYDLRTAVKLKILEGHKAPSSSLCFSPTGKYLASFSEGESAVRVWKVILEKIVKLTRLEEQLDF
jgi:WD repeat-containing protein 7